MARSMVRWMAVPRRLGRRQGRRLGWLSVVVALALVPLVSPATTPTARATVGTVGPVCSLQNGCAPEFAPPPLLNRGLLASVDEDTRAALDAFSAEAVDRVLQLHQLPETDANAILGWDRTEAQAHLWMLISEAMQANPADRTADQQLVVDWMTSMVRSQYQAGAVEAGAEYARWAGLNKWQYRTLVESDASEADLKAYLSQTPSGFPYDNSYGTAEKAGFCNYRPPAPYQDDYDAHNFVTCSSPCPSVLGCEPPTPTYDEFVAWGETIANRTITSAAYTAQMANIAAGIGAAVVAVGTAIGVAVAMSATIGAALASITPLVSFIGTGVAVEFFSLTASAVIGEAALPVAADVAGVTLGAGAGAVIGALVFAVVTATLKGIQIFDADKLPGKLAALIAGTRTEPIDVQALSQTDDGGALLFSLFVGATLPRPDTSVACDNTLIPPWHYTVWRGGQEYMEYVPLGYTQAVETLADRSGCLNPPEIPEPVETDPTFRVKAQGSTQETRASSITLRDPVSATTHTVRASGNWFVDSIATDGVADVDTVQTLRLRYVDWSGDIRYVWLFQDPTTGAYSFWGMAGDENNNAYVDADCEATGTCFETDHIEYLGADGNKYSARLVGYAAPVGTPVVETPHPVEGKPVVVNANGFTFAGAVAPVRYNWQFQQTGCGLQGCRTLDPSTLTWHPVYGPLSVGARTGNTWQAAGKQWVRLRVIDSTGEQAETEFQIDVAPVPPVIELSNCEPTDVQCERQWSLGQETQMEAPIFRAGSNDYLTVSWNWGDGTVDTQYVGEQLFPPDQNGLSLEIQPGDPLHIAARARHVYAQPGLYFGTVTVTNWAGGAVEAPFRQMIVGRQVLTMPPVGDHVYGETVEMQATSSNPPNPVRYTASPASVCEATGAYGYQIRMVGIGQCTVMAYQEPQPPVWLQPVPVTRTFAVTKAPLTVTADDKEAAFGAAYPAYTATFDGLVGGDKPADYAPVFTGPAPGAAIGSYPITVSGLSDPNYDITYRPGTLRIAENAISVVVDDATKVYGSADPEFTATVIGLPPGRTVESEFPNFRVVGPPTDSHVGTYPITVTGLNNPGYAVESIDTGVLTITKAPLTITADDKTRAYGAATPPLTAQFDGLVAGDSPGDIDGLQLTGPAAGVGVGTHPIVASGATSPDYDITLVDGTLTVTPASLTIVAEDKRTRYGRVATYTWHGEGWVNGDTDATLAQGPNQPPTCTATVAGAPAGVTTAPGRYAGAITCAGAVNANYTITTRPGRLIIDPVLTLGQLGLPAGVRTQAVVDGVTVGVPAEVQLSIGDVHEYAFTRGLAPSNTTVYVTAQTPFKGVVSTNITARATYLPMLGYIAAAMLSGDIPTSVGIDLVRRWGVITLRAGSGSGAAARPELRNFATRVRNQRGVIKANAVTTLIAGAQALYTRLGGAGEV